MNLFDLTGKTALITGASSGLGERMAYALAENGATVILAARRIEKLEAMAKAIKNAIAIELDITSKSSIQKAFKNLEENEIKIDICINNAGIGGTTPIFEENLDNRFEAIMETNVIGLWHVTKAAANHMKNNKIAGSIINIASINGTTRLINNFAGYSASKAAVIQLTKALTRELAHENIRINAIAPGLFHTPLTNYRLDSEEKRKENKNLIPLAFIADPQDLDGTILYLASNKASRYVTGSVLTIDGGISCMTRS